MLYLGLFVAGCVAFSLSAICGGGAGLLLIPILGYALPVAHVPTALTLATSASSVSRIWFFYEQIRWDIVKLFLPTALVGVILGAWLLSYLDPVYLEVCMGIFLVSNLPLLLTAPKTSSPAFSQLSGWQLRLIGFLAGFISGLTGAVGVLFNRFYIRYGLSNTEIVATRAANEAMLHLIKIYLYASLGLLTLNTLQIGLIIALAATLTSYVMQSVLPKIPRSLFAKIGYAAMVIAGVLMLNSALVRLKIQHEPELRLEYLAKGLDASLSWDTLLYSVEFKYAEGFEFEKVVPFSSLSKEQQLFVYSLQALYAEVVIEKVFTLTSQSYEAYFYDEKHHLLKKVKFKSAG